MCGEPVEDGLQHSRRFGQHLSVVEPKHFEARLADGERTQAVLLDCIGLEVLPAIEFNHEAGFQAGEVGEEGANGVLAAEFATGQASTAQRVPQHLLRIG